MNASFEYTPLQFKRPAGTSRGILTTKHSWLIHLKHGNKKGIGECSIIPGLSPDFNSIEAYESILEKVIQSISTGELTSENAPVLLADKPSILFGVECAFLDLNNGGNQIYFKNDFSIGKKKIPINGLIWMGDEIFMQEQIEQKLQEGFSTIKMKIGAIDFDKEFKLLQKIRSRYDEFVITLRVDANGAFNVDDAFKKLNQLASIGIHSMEQPIKQGFWEDMKELCSTSPIPIALDEELIGVVTRDEKIKLLDTIQPPFIILKPSLHGGIFGTKEWISLAMERNINWWITSALESNIGLKAICELAAEYDNNLPQGLGTGGLYENNFPSNLKVENGHIFIDSLN